jgi:phosphatidylinositol 4-kinase
LKRQQAAHNLLAPHSRLLQFLGSHFNATRLGSPHTQQIFHRLLRSTLDGLNHSTGHPLARELRFQIVLFGLKVLRHSTAMSAIAQWRLKDKVLRAALGWFAFAPRWTFGGNRLQLKAEITLLEDLKTALYYVRIIGFKRAGTLASLQAKEDLLTLLLENERARLSVWLLPLGDVSNHSSKEPSEVNFLKLL